METTKLDIALQSERSEEIQHIIERMPTRFALWITLIVLFLFTLMGAFGWLVRYPDIVQGQIVINSSVSPLKLVANTSGKLKICSVKSMDEVKSGQVIAYVENATNPTNIACIDSLIKPYNPNSEAIMQLYPKLPKSFSLGELNEKYYAFTTALQLMINYRQDHLYENQEANLLQISKEQKKAIEAARQRVGMAENNLKFAHKFYLRDSLLFIKKVISEAELDKTQLNYISSKDAHQSALNNLTNAMQNLQQTDGQIKELGVTKPEKEKELRISLISAYNSLTSNIEIWEQKYVFKAPFDGKVQFLKFYSENQFVQAGEQIFTIIPGQNSLYGQMIVPSQGSGKIKEGQEVIVKLDNFPYNEYGSVKAKVNTISLTTSTTKTETNEIETYQILIDFPNQLKTNYGTTLTAKAETKGTGEIITNDRRLIQRLFDNLKYIMSK